MKQKIISSIMSIVLLSLSFDSNATQITITQTYPTSGGITYSATYDNIACVGDQITITYTVVNNNSYAVASPCNFAGFTPDCSAALSHGLTNPIVVAPQSSSIQPPVGQGFQPFDKTIGCNWPLQNCSGSGTNPYSQLGYWDLIDNFPPGIPYTFTVTVTASICGVQSFSPCICETVSSYSQCLGTISILIIPYADLTNESTGPFCENSTGITGVLPAPVCLGPSPSCTEGGVTSCYGYSGGCTHITCPGEPCCTAYDGTCLYSYNYTVGPAVGGTVTLLDDTSGLYEFTPASNFYGTGLFYYNVVSDSSPPYFCTPTQSGQISFSIAQSPIASNTGYTICEGVEVSGSLVPLVTGGSGDYTFFETGPVTCGEVTITPSGTFYFTAPVGITGSVICSFGYQVNDTVPPYCPSNEATVTVLVEEGPTADDQTLATCVGGPVSGTVTATGGTPPYTFAVVPGSEVNGTVTAFDPSTGTFTFTPTGPNGSVGSFEFNVTDANGCTSLTPGVVTIDIEASPQIMTGSVAACSATAKSGNLNPLVSGNGPFTFTGPISQTNGTTVITSNGLFTFTPNAGVTGGSFVFGATDRDGCFNTGTELIVVNQSPTAIAATGAACPNTKVTGSVANDVTGGMPPYIFSLYGTPVNGSATVSSTGLYTFTPNAGATTGSFDFQAVDASGCNAIGMVNITVNSGPIAGTGSFSGCGTEITGDLGPLASGAYPPFTFSGPIGSVIDGSVIIDPSGTFEFFPNVNEGIGGFNYIVTDSNMPPCTSTPGFVTIYIDEGPIAMPALFTGCINQTITGSLVHFVSGGIPPYIFAQYGPTPACAASITIAPAGTFSFTPAVNFSGPCTFAYQVTDSTPCTSTGPVTINVNPDPVVTDSGPFTACEFDGYTGNLNSFVVSGTPPFSFTGDAAVNGTVVISPSGPYTFTPAGVGPGSFTFSATDANGCMSNTGIITFDATESPILTGPNPIDTCQGTPVSSFVTASGSVGIQPFTFSIINTTNGTAVITSTTATTANYTFTPTVSVFPTPTVMGSVTIRASASNDCFDDFTVIVNIHQNPIALSTGIGSCSPSGLPVVTGNLNTLVTGGIPPYTFVQTGPVSPIGCGMVYVDPAGPFILTGPSGATGTCSFVYEVTESSASHCTATGEVSVTFNEPLIVSDGSFCSCFATPVTGNLSSLVVGGKPPYTFAIVGTPVGGTVYLNPLTGLFTFVPNPGFTGIASFVFQVTDSNSPPCVGTGTVTIQVPCCLFTGATGLTGSI